MGTTGRMPSSSGCSLDTSDFIVRFVAGKNLRAGMKKENENENK
jgi:hypothetical protein